MVWLMLPMPQGSCLDVARDHGLIELFPPSSSRFPLQTCPKVIPSFVMGPPHIPSQALPPGNLPGDTEAQVCGGSGL